MTEETSELIEIVNAFAVATLLVLNLRCERRRLKGMHVLLNQHWVKKPYFVIELSDGEGYLLIAQEPQLEEMASPEIAVMNDEDGLLGKERKSFTPLQQHNFLSFSRTSRAKIRHGLLIKVPQQFPDISSRSFYRIISMLALAEGIYALGVPGNGVYFRLPELVPGSHGAKVAKVSRVTPEGIESLRNISVLCDQAWMHGVIYFPSQLSEPDKEIFIITMPGIGAVAVPLTQSARYKTGEETVEAILKGYRGDHEVVQAYIDRHFKKRVNGEVSQYKGESSGLLGNLLVGWIYSEAQPDVPVDLDIYVDGRIIDTITADTPLICADSVEGPTECGYVYVLDQSLLDGERREIKICYAGTSEPVHNAPILLGQGLYDGNFSTTREGYVAGWVRERTMAPDPATVEVVVDGKIVSRATAGSFCELFTRSKIAGHNSGFCVELPDCVFDGQEHRIQAVVVSGKRKIELTESIRIQADYAGEIEAVTTHRITGWIVNEAAPLRPVEMELIANGKTFKLGKSRMVRQRGVGRSGMDGQRQVFDFDIPKELLSEPGITLVLRVAGTQDQVIGPKIIIAPYDVALRSLMTVSEVLNDLHHQAGDSKNKLSGGLEANPDILYWLRSQVIAKAIAALREHKTFPPSLTLPLAPIVSCSHRSDSAAMIDVIVPVYRGFRETMACLDSVLAGENGVDYELIVVNDQSPESELTEWLSRMAGDSLFTLLENETNLGFVGTVNRAMRLHPERDVVLLNSDTVVPSGWLDRLYRAAYSQANVGTVTPFSNNATICSFPEPCVVNGLPSGSHLKEIDGLFQTANDGVTLDLPTAIGFCMFIKRAALHEVGEFDEQEWGDGYGEENDFCLRASALGWRHVVACDVFVQHHGAVSFAESCSNLIEKNLKRLNELYPDYSNTVHRFISQDPLRSCRNTVLKALLKKHAGEYMLFIMHSMGGGTEVAADELSARLREDGCAVLQLVARADGRWTLKCPELPLTLHYRYPDDWRELIEDLRDLGVWHVHYHQTMHFPAVIWTLADALEIAYDFTAHDYLPICPRITMIDESGRYCNVNRLSTNTCNRCLEKNGTESGLEQYYAELGGDIVRWRQRHGIYMAGARTIFFPSKDTADRYMRYFNLSSYRIIPHPEKKREIIPWTPALDRPCYSIAIIGAIGMHKGYQVLEDCAGSAQEQGLPLHFVVIGYTCDDERLLRFYNVTITGRYEREDLPKIIGQHSCFLALFLSPWPETYCYALSEAWASGLYAVAFDIGALAERIREAGYGELIPLTFTGMDINHRLLDLIEKFRKPFAKLQFGADVKSVSRDYYGFENRTKMRASPMAR